MRVDAAPDSICVVIPIPPEIEGVPDIPNNGEQHVTLVYVGQGSEEDALDICEIVAGSGAPIVGQPMSLGPLGHFERPGAGLVAHSRVLVTPTISEAREGTVGAIEGAGYEIKHHPGPWKPHATLAYMQPGELWEGAVPEGTWFATAPEVWRGPDRYVRGADGPLVRRDGEGWAVISPDGAEQGRYASKADAVARLDRSDEEKAEIRSRWAKKGASPNMGEAGLKKWLESPFAGPNRKSGDERKRAARVARRALRIMGKSVDDWTDADYDGAVQIMAFIARHNEGSGGDPIVIDGREGPSPKRAALMDWGFDPKIAARSDGAPAIITDSKTMVEVYRQDAAVISAATAFDPSGAELWTVDMMAPRLDAEQRPEVHPDGWVEFSVYYSRAGNVQRYGDALEYRPHDEVFSPRAMASGRGGPWELRHSKELLSPRTVRGVARGCMMTFDRHPDGQHTFGRAKAWDADLIEAIGSYAPEVSLAWRGLVDRREGTSDSGERFTQIARHIIVNSLASEPKGRAGPTVKVHRDSAEGPADAVVSRARSLLAVAETRPQGVVYIDAGRWVRYDADEMAFRLTLDESLPVVEGDWDSGPAKARIFEDATSADGEFDAGRAADAFLIADPSTGKKGDLHMPVVDIRDGRKVIVANALRAARSRLGQGYPLDVPADVRDRANEAAGRLLEQHNEKKDQAPMPLTKLITMMLERRSMTPADAAEKLGVNEADLMTMLANPESIDDAMLAKMAELMSMEAPAPEMADDAYGGDEKKKMLAKLVRDMADMDREALDGAMRKIMAPAADMDEAPELVEVEIGEETIKVSPDAVEKIKAMQVRADKADDADLVPRADALVDALVLADVIEHARRSFGDDYTPTPRQDCAGQDFELPRPSEGERKDSAEHGLTVLDWCRSALIGAFGDKGGQAKFDEVMSMPEAARPHVMRMRLDDAKSVLDEKRHTGKKQLERIRQMRDAQAERDHGRQDADEDEIAAQIKAQQKIAGARRGA